MEVVEEVTVTGEWEAVIWLHDVSGFTGMEGSGSWEKEAWLKPSAV